MEKLRLLSVMIMVTLGFGALLLAIEGRAEEYVRRATVQTGPNRVVGGTDFDNAAWTPTVMTTSITPHHCGDDEYGPSFFALLVGLILWGPKLLLKGWVWYRDWRARRLAEARFPISLRATRDLRELVESLTRRVAELEVEISRDRKTL